MNGENIYNQVPFLICWKQVVLAQTKNYILHGILQMVQKSHLTTELF